MRIACRVADGPLARASRRVGHGLPDRRQNRSRPKYVFREQLPLHSWHTIGDGKSRSRTRASGAIEIHGPSAFLIGRIAVP